ncbi:MAG: ABC transporter permease subunit [Clostridium sp.]
MRYFTAKTKRASLIRLVMECISGLPSIVLGLFSYTVLVRDIGLGRCILSASAALAIMILPFIEVRAEKAFREVPESVVQSACALGCSKAYTIRKVVFQPAVGNWFPA